MQKYLESSHYIDVEHSSIVQKAAELAQKSHSELELIKHCFEFVRDEIKHSADYNLNPVTCRASDVLKYATGYCYAKSHLLAALLRANHIPTGLCYQRLSVGDYGAPYCLHGLNAVFLKQYGWYRLDARGNKAGVNAQFSPPIEALAFPIREPMERDLPEIWAEPLQCVINVLEQYSDVKQVYHHLPDIDLIS